MENSSAVAGIADQAETVIAVITVVTAFAVQAGDWRRRLGDMRDEGLGGW